MEADWTLSPQAAVARQRELASQVVRRDELGEPHWVAGIDVGFPQRGRVTRAAAVLMCVDTLETVACATVTLPTRFPYVPGSVVVRWPWVGASEALRLGLPCGCDHGDSLYRGR